MKPRRRKWEKGKEKNESEERNSFLEIAGYLRQWESARYSKSSKSSTSRGCVSRGRAEAVGAVSALSWRGEAKEKQKGAARRKGAGFTGGRGWTARKWWQTKRTLRGEGRNEERGETRDTITSCTRRAWSHFQTLLHEALGPPFSSTSQRAEYVFLSTTSFCPSSLPLPLSLSLFLGANFVPQRREDAWKLKIYVYGFCRYFMIFM